MPGDDDQPRDRVVREGRRVVDRLRSVPLTRLAGDPSIGMAARSTGQRLADVAASSEGRPARPVPDVGDHAVGDQIAVLVADLLAAESTDDVLAQAADDLITLRRSLP